MNDLVGRGDGELTNNDVSTSLLFFCFFLIYYHLIIYPWEKYITVQSFFVDGINGGKITASLSLFAHRKNLILATKVDLDTDKWAKSNGNKSTIKNQFLKFHRFSFSIATRFKVEYLEEKKKRISILIFV